MLHYFTKLIPAVFVQKNEWLSLEDKNMTAIVGSIANTWTILNSSELNSIKNQGSKIQSLWKWPYAYYLCAGPITTFACCFTLLNLDKTSLLLDGPEYQADRLQRGRTVSMSAVCHDLGFWSNDTDSWNFLRNYIWQKVEDRQNVVLAAASYSCCCLETLKSRLETTHPQKITFVVVCNLASHSNQ